MYKIYWCGHHIIAHLWRLSLSFMLSLFGFILSIGLVFEIVRIIILVFEIVQDLFRRVYLYYYDSWKLYIKLQMVPFVFFFYRLLLLLRLFALICLVVIPNTLGGKPKVNQQDQSRWEAQVVLHQLGIRAQPDHPFQQPKITTDNPQPYSPSENNSTTRHAIIQIFTPRNLLTRA